MTNMRKGAALAIFTLLISFLSPMISASEAVHAVDQGCGIACEGISASPQELSQQLLQFGAAGQFEATSNTVKNDILNEEIAPIARGENRADCGIDTRILQSLVILVKQYGYLRVSELNRKCPYISSDVSCAGSSSMHCESTARAVDLWKIGGVQVDGGTETEPYLAFLNTFMPAGTNALQGQCGRTNDPAWTNLVIGYIDACTHQHVDFRSTTGDLNLTTAPPAEDLGYQISFMGSNGVLWSVNQALQLNQMGQALKPGTSPSVARFAGGSWVTAFQGNDGKLWTVDSALNLQNIGITMKSTSSPSITAIGSGWIIAFQGADGVLYTVDNQLRLSKIGPTMMATSSPSITSLSGGGWGLTFQGSDSVLYYVNNQIQLSKLGPSMKSTSSPSIAGLPSGNAWVVAFQGANGQLYTVNNQLQLTQVGPTLKATSSPSITAMADGGWTLAFHGSNGVLYALNNQLQLQNLGATVKDATSPSIATLGNNGWLIAFNGSDSILHTVDNSYRTQTVGPQMFAGSSPAIN